METQEIAKVILDRLGDLILAPVVNEDMFWIVIPLIIATLLMTLYFGRYKDEELGWNTAYGNSMIFLFVALDIFRYMYKITDTPSFWNLVNEPLYLGVTSVLLGIGILLLIVNYYHFLPEKLDFILCSGPPVNVTAYTMLSIVYAKIIPDKFTAIAAFLFLIVLMAALRILQLFQRILSHNLGLGSGLKKPKKNSEKKAITEEPAEEDANNEQDQEETNDGKQ
jgi:hypothetical protein